MTRSKRHWPAWVLVLVLAAVPVRGRTAAAACEEDRLVATPLPENALDDVVLSGGWDELGLGGRLVPYPPPRTPVALPVRRTFWGTAETSLFAGTLISFAGLNVADYLLTRERLDYPELGEVNPFLAPIVKNPWSHALYKIGTVALNTVGLINLHRYDKPVAWAMSLVTNLLMALTISSLDAELDAVRRR